LDKTEVEILHGQSKHRIKDMLPKISLITCSYNHKTFLEDTINSVLNQKYPNLEYIIIDGGSTDGSVDVIKKYARHLSYWVSERDRGQTHALIKGFAQSTGDIQSWLCSDDLLEVGALQDVASFFLEHPKARVVYGDTTYIDKNARIIRVKRLPGYSHWFWVWDGCSIPQPSTFWRRDLYMEVGGLKEKYDVAMDQDLWFRFSEITRIWHVSRLWSRQRLYPEAKTRKFNCSVKAERGLIDARTLELTSGKLARLLLPGLARGLRLFEEEILCIINWLKNNEPERPRDNPFLGIRPTVYFSFKRWSGSRYA
jgi:glycosyltransferase involved in cell wall biosynthesis